MRLVEIWALGNKDSSAHLLIEPHSIRDNTAENGWQTHKNTNGYVINGCYYVARDKEYNILRIFGAPSGDRDHAAYYLGDVEYNGDYNETIQEYEDTRKVVGQNLIKVKISEAKKKDSWSDEPAF
jgi:hypothetical protein